MSRVVAAGSFIEVLLMSTAALRAAPAEQPLRVGDRFPALKGQFLTGHDAVLPQASSGQVALVAIGFTYKSRFSVETWAEWDRTVIDPKTDVTLSFSTGMASCGGSITEDSTLLGPTS